MFASMKNGVLLDPFMSRAHVQGSFEIQVKKPDGSIRKQFAEWSLFAWLRKKGYAFPKVMWLTGRMSDKVNVKNLVTNAGFAVIAARLGSNATEAVADYLEVGTGTTAAAAGDTALETAITDSGLARAQGTVSRVTTTQTNDTHQVAYTWTASGSKAITECGLFNSSSGADLVGRNVFSAVNVVSGDSFALTYKVKIA